MVNRRALLGLVGMSLLTVALDAVVPKVAAAASGGSLIEYTLQGGGWTAVNVTAGGSTPIAGDGVPFVDPLTGFQNAYATSGDGDLTEYTRLPAGNWISADLTAAARGPNIADSPQPFTDPLTGFQNAYATTADGHLVEYTRLPLGNWTSVDLTGVYGGQPVSADPRPFTDPLTGLQNAYVTSQTGDLVEYTRLAAGNWIAFDISAHFGLPTFGSAPAPFAVGTAQVVFGATNGGGHLIQFARNSVGSWSAIDVTDAADGPTVTGDPSVIVDPLTHFLNVYDSQAPVDSIAPRVPGASSYASGRSGTAGFTLVDTASDSVYTGGAADAMIRTASVIKVPIAMTLAARANSQGRGFTSDELGLLHLMITQSDNDAATALWNEVGGSSAVIGLMDSLGASATHPYTADPEAWGFTVSTSRDLALVLAQLARGVLGATDTGTILNEMHEVIASQRWGIGAALPQAAVKNGWFPDPGDWRVNCLGIAGGTRYALAVMTEYPIDLGQGYGEDTCQQIAARLLPDLTEDNRQGATLAPGAVPAITGVGITADGG